MELSQRLNECAQDLQLAIAVDTASLVESLNVAYQKDEANLPAILAEFQQDLKAQAEEQGDRLGRRMSGHLHHLQEDLRAQAEEQAHLLDEIKAIMQRQKEPVQAAEAQHSEFPEFRLKDIDFGDELGSGGFGKGES